VRFRASQIEGGNVPVKQLLDAANTLRYGLKNTLEGNGPLISIEILKMRDREIRKADE
jgi:hypothetical protein